MSHTAPEAATHTDAHGDAHGHGGAHPHVMPLSVLFGVFAALIIFTVLTVTASKMALGAAEIWVAMGIATIKALLVAAIFMHLIFDKPFNSYLIVSSIVFATIFVGMTLADSQSYQPEIEAEAIQQSVNAPAAPDATVAPAAAAAGAAADAHPAPAAK